MHQSREYPQGDSRIQSPVTAFVDMPPTSMPIAAPSTSSGSASLVPTASPTEIKINGLNLVDHIILSILLLVFAILVVVGINIYCCIKRNTCGCGDYYLKRKIRRGKSMDQKDKSIVQDSPFDVHAAGGDVEMDDKGTAHDEDIIPEYSSKLEKEKISL
jgi:hypothetical protein